MDLYIVVRGSNGRIVKVTAQENGIVEEGTLRSAFKLEKDVPVCLFRADIALRRRRDNDEFSFVLGKDWKNGEFELQWDETRRSRPSSRVDSLGFTDEEAKYLHELCSRGINSKSSSRSSTPISHEQPQAEDLERYSMFQGYLRCINLPNKWKGCVTVINDRYAVTNAHVAVKDIYDTYRKQCNELAENMKTKKLKMDTELQQDNIIQLVNAEQTNLLHKLVVVYKINDDKLQVETKIVHVDLIVDFVVLYAAGGGLLDEHLMPLELGTAQHGNNYLLLGLPISPNNSYQGLSMLKGNVSNASGMAHKKGYIIGAYGADHGYSGGPVIRLGVNNDLLGIVVSGSRDGQQLVQIIPACQFVNHIGKGEMILNDAQNEVWPPTD